MTQPSCSPVTWATYFVVTWPTFDQWLSGHVDQWSSQHTHHWLGQYVQWWLGKHILQWLGERVHHWLIRHVHQWLRQNVPQWSDQHVHLIVRKIKKKRNDLAYKFLVKLTGENVSFVERILLFIETYNFLILSFLFWKLLALWRLARKTIQRKKPVSRRAWSSSFCHNLTTWKSIYTSNISFLNFYHMCILFLISKNRILQKTKSFKSKNLVS